MGSLIVPKPYLSGATMRPITNDFYEKEMHVNLLNLTCTYHKDQSIISYLWCLQHQLPASHKKNMQTVVVSLSLKVTSSIAKIE